MLNDNICNIPSASLKPGDVVSVREKSKSLESIQLSINNTIQSHDWIEWNGDTMSGTVKTLPNRDQIPENIKEQLIVEIYSK